MGKPATTYWCGNGHLLEDNAHHEYGPRDLRCMDPYILDDNGEVVEENEWKCEVCGSTEEYSTIEWSDPDYWQDEEPEVPLAPISYDEVERTDHRGNKYFVRIGVYDISALRARCQKKD